ncbi:CDP-glucose 4,6-dehydratase [Candidatus Kuenenia sp.]|uniref:CDP-glucose 4,6-dehydratase n=1 Tax=Candidatus Kuenenia sp. TaxID=2499824 RepID=UPI003220726C
MVINKTFWKNKKVLITGHTGFKGSWLSLWLQNMGANVIGYSLPPATKPNMFEVANVSAGMESIAGDIRDIEQVTKTVSKYQPEIIIHMAAQSLVRYSYSNPVETYATNVMGTVNILDAVRQIKCVKVVVIVTSDKCYENKEWLWGYRENDPMGGHDPYSSSKGCAELVTSAYRSSFFPVKDYKVHGVAVSSVRAGNVIGGGDWSEDRLIPDIMKAFMDKRIVKIRNPNSIRPWQYVLEPLRGYLGLAERLWLHGSGFAEAWNFGPKGEDVRPVSWIIESLSEQWGEDARWELGSTQQLHEASHLKLDCSKAQNLLGWESRLDLSTTLQWIVAWYRGYQQKKNMRNLTEAEIVRYEKSEGT